MIAGCAIWQWKAYIGRVTWWVGLNAHSCCRWVSVQPLLWTHSVRQHRASVVPDTEGEQGAPAQHRGSQGHMSPSQCVTHCHSTDVHRVTCRHRSASPTASTNDWSQSPRETCIHDSHHGFIASYGPPSDNPVSREAMWLLLPCHLGGKPSLRPWVLLAGQLQWDGSGPQPAPTGSSPDPVHLGDVAERGLLWPEGLGMLPSTMSCYLRTSVGKGCSSAFCCTYFNWRSSLAIHLGLHCLHN